MFQTISTRVALESARAQNRIKPGDRVALVVWSGLFVGRDPGRDRFETWYGTASVASGIGGQFIYWERGALARKPWIGIPFERKRVALRAQ